MKRGRAETALNHDLNGDDSIGPTERAALRVCARALDHAEAEHDGDLVNALSRTYLELRTAAGLSRNSPAKPASDPFDVLASALAGPSVLDAPQP